MPEWFDLIKWNLLGIVIALIVGAIAMWCIRKAHHRAIRKINEDYEKKMKEIKERKAKDLEYIRQQHAKIKKRYKEGMKSIFDIDKDLHGR